ncbi:dehydrogenase/reductase SDR family member 13-like isoform X1 [Gymnodraco acuticeps]|uniref:Dehydrogenase/reductase SDR family member 13-like isoform X1 n=1 Tax=Gymnodraco acuticeps TaxID=8218 RepID=A0A6P8U4I0_GYMAC|nr:dehydrogenase/reductase SDR family member 13-like isoform X1 [Gymnodraco acuticeps]
MSVLLCLAAGALCLYLILYYNVFKGARYCSSVKLRGKTAIVTGSNTGIGKSTALDLAKRGARVIIVCRNKDKAEAAAFDIRRMDMCNNVCRRVGTIRWCSCSWIWGISSLFAALLKPSWRRNPDWTSSSTTQRCVSGVVGHGHTDDDFDLAFGVNHLGHFLLTNLLLERLQKCGPSRVVTVASIGHRLGKAHFPLMTSKKDLVSGQSMWRNLQAYCDSKLCNVLFTRELANRLEGTSVSCFCLHPGYINTELRRSLSLWQQLLLIPFAKLFLQDPEGGAQTTLHCALQEGIEPFSGRYFSNCALQQVGAKGRDDALAKKLWETSSPAGPSQKTAVLFQAKGVCTSPPDL